MSQMLFYFAKFPAGNRIKYGLQDLLLLLRGILEATITIYVSDQ